MQQVDVLEGGAHIDRRVVPVVEEEQRVGSVAINDGECAARHRRCAHRGDNRAVRSELPLQKYCCMDN